MKITEIKINLVRNQNPLKAFASITIEDCFVVHDLRIIKTEDKIFVAMPSKRVPDGNREQEYKDIAHPINKETRDEIEKMVLDKYYAVTGETS